MGCIAAKWDASKWFFFKKVSSSQISLAIFEKRIIVTKSEGGMKCFPLFEKLLGVFFPVGISGVSRNLFSPPSF